MPTYAYPRPMLTVDITVFRKIGDQVQVLLIQRGRAPFEGCWALPGGFINLDENLEESAARELQEETGLVIQNMDQVRTYGDPDRDPRGRVISVAYAALLTDSTDTPMRAGSDAGAARWFSITDLPALAFDHQQIIQDAFSFIKPRLG